jgi:hypothetical protein
MPVAAAATPTLVTALYAAHASGVAPVAVAVAVAAAL